MADGIRIDVDAADVMAMLVQLGDTAEVLIHDASRVTAARIQDEARARARRRTGRLVEAIEVEEQGPPMHGFKVVVGEMTDERGRRAEEFAIWHEFGTKKMAAQPFMFNSAKLEEGPHYRRVVEALQAAIDKENG